ncbi:MAG: hypothetical protein ACPGVG_02900, partial [Mycobacterium sp.]
LLVPRSEHPGVSQTVRSWVRFSSYRTLPTVNGTLGESPDSARKPSIADKYRRVPFPLVTFVRDEEVVGSNPATPTQ